MSRRSQPGWKWRVFRVYLLMWVIHFAVSLIAHCGVVGWYSVNPGSAGEIAENGSRILSLSVGLPTYPVRINLTYSPLMRSTEVVIVGCVVVDSAVYALLYTWGYFSLRGLFRRAKSE